MVKYGILKNVEVFVSTVPKNVDFYDSTENLKIV